MQATTDRPPAPTKKRLVNEASWDRVVRILIGAVMLYLGWTGALAGTWGTVFRYLGFVPLLTGLIGWCPLYHALGFSTNRA
jgi:hypothetical protein